MIIGTDSYGMDFYAWNPNFLQSKDPGTGKYFGNVVGNFSLEDQLKIVDDEGDRQKQLIQAASQEQIVAIGVLSEKFVRLWGIVDEVTEAVTGDDPVERDGADPEEIEAFINEWIENAANAQQNTSPETPAEEEPAPAAVPLDDGFYLWIPNYFQIRDPRTGKYFGNVVGNVSLEEQLRVVDEAGDQKKKEILEAGAEYTQEILDMSEKFRYVTGVNKDAMKEIIAFFGGVFVLDSSALDSAPLG